MYIMQRICCSLLFGSHLPANMGGWDSLEMYVSIVQIFPTILLYSIDALQRFDEKVPCACARCP